MATVYHPAFGTAREVPDDALARWHAAGWKSDPPGIEPEPDQPPAAPEPLEPSDGDDVPDKPARRRRRTKKH